ncbi:MAG: DUF342 domain-containing protein [Lachnospiraceae bacterium]|nr:DUF342 domain-containing protein [Lachnospiraceae bacterium]
MRNGYFRLVTTAGGYGVKLFPPKDGGEGIRLLELINYLDNQKIVYNALELKQAVAENQEKVVSLGVGGEPCPPCEETYLLKVAEGNMSATARFFPASETGKRLSFDEFLRDLRMRNIKSGIDMQVLQEHFQSEGIYCTDLEVAKGKVPRHGSDARIEYYFNTDVHAQPEMREDGSVDYFHLNVVNHCHVGDVLAKIVPADEGEYGMDILGNRIKPREVKKMNLRFGKNIALSEDRMSISSLVDGHVMLVDDSVFVSDVYEVENVDTSTGNIEFAGSVQVNGNVSTNFKIKARGNVIVNGVVEGAHIEAGGNIIIARGMNGMSKGTLKAGGNIVAKFLESTTAEADGYVNAESLLHCNVSAGTEIVVNGKRGFVTGGHIQADDKIDVKNLGATLGASTIVEVGVNPKLKAQYLLLQKEISEIVRAIKAAQPVLANFAEKRARGANFSADQLKYVKETAALLETKKVELETKNQEMKELQQIFNPQKKSAVIVRGEVYPGTTIIIGDVSMVLQSSYKYCQFEKINGEVKMLPL